MAELQRLSPPLWGLAEAARAGATTTPRSAVRARLPASAAVTDATYLFPYLLTGVRAHLAPVIAAAGTWPDRVGAVLTARAIPGTLPAIDHARGLILHARGDTAAQQALESAGARGRPGAGSGKARGPGLTSPRPPPRHGAAARRPAPGRGRTTAAAPAPPLCRRRRPARRVVRPRPAGRAVASAERARVRGRQAGRRRPHQPADRGALVLAPKTISAHVEHILAKLGAAGARRSRLVRDPSGRPPHRDG